MGSMGYLDGRQVLLDGLVAFAEQMSKGAADAWEPRRDLSCRPYMVEQLVFGSRAIGAI